MIQRECLLYCTEEMLSGKAFHRDVFHSAMYLHFHTSVEM